MQDHRVHNKKVVKAIPLSAATGLRLVDRSGLDQSSEAGDDLPDTRELQRFTAAALQRLFYFRNPAIGRTIYPFQHFAGDHFDQFLFWSSALL